ncbi:dUTP diphosphatase [Patescibacteria group bacterium]|nr:dUTP diphosphatase [Patescibacteria group bacterium]
MSKTIYFKKIHPKAQIPTYAYQDDVGLDLYSTEDKIIKAGTREIIPTGLASILPPQYGALLWDRSGLAAKHGLTVLAGVIDPGYRGEWKVVLLNTSPKDYQIKVGDRIAQALIQKVKQFPIQEVDELSETDRGEGCTGSSGR